MSDVPSATAGPADAACARRAILEGVVLAFGSAVFFSWLAVRPEYIGNISDTAVYLTLSDYFSPWRDAPHTLGPAMFQDFSFPPLFPLTLALLGGGSEHPTLSYVATALMMGAAVGAVYVWLRTLTVQAPAALAMALVFALLPVTMMTAMGMQSEPLYAALVFAGLACWNQRTVSPSMAAFAGGLLGLSVLARTVGVAAVGALLVCWALERVRARDWHRGWSVAVLAVAPIGGWVLTKQALGMNESYVDLVRQDSFGATLAFFSEQLMRNPRAIWAGLVHGIDLLGTLHATIAITLFTSLFFLAWGIRLRRFELDAIYLLFYLGIILLWPFPNHMRRFLQVVIPIYLYYVYFGSVTLARFVPGASPRHTVAAGIIAAVTIVALPSTSAMIGQVIAAEGTEAEDFVRTPQWYMYDSPIRATAVMDRVRQVLDAMRGIDENLPPEACVSSAIYSYIPLYGRRRAGPVPRVSVPDDEFFARLKRCPYVFMMAGSVWPPSDFPSMYPHERIKDRLEVIEVSLWDRTASSGAVMTMLARVRFPEAALGGR